MAEVYRANRKAHDADILRMNSVGLSLATIAATLDCHPTTITLRLKSLGVEPADTRRSFMEDVFSELEPAEREWLADQLSPEYPIKAYIRDLLRDEFRLRAGQSPRTVGAPVPDAAIPEALQTATLHRSVPAAASPRALAWIQAIRGADLDSKADVL